MSPDMPLSSGTEVLWPRTEVCEVASTMIKDHARQKIRLLQTPQELSSIYKTRSQLIDQKGNILYFLGSTMA